ncbi:hypothetical protein LTR56_003101 [Elasticomyces elasticus]|nr:hypothetical protein LTR22_014321 [Elasticomyces elasticus]KAK3656398.1 hypothetical protein LTR56_003101 [Elasticomyces elasticus]KAK4927476.1 hypothetical protein LTR49_005615 [Elasticomyces elasticus]KAK5750134.1 hypothetical protein LTS12_019784 [Elasticomyces elasticus]
MADPAPGSSKRKATGADSGPEAKRFRPNFSDIITVVVGEEKELFTVHTASICRKSEFFRAACKREWQEGKDKTIPLPDIKPPIFTLYVNWAYTGVLDIEIGDSPDLVQNDSQSADGDDTTQKKKEVASWDLRQSNLVALHLAADFLLDEALKDRSIDGLLEIKGSSLNLHSTLVSEIWGSTATGSGLRKLMLDRIISHSDGRDYIANRRGDSRVPAEFFIDVAERSLALHGPLRAVKPKLSRKDEHYDRNLPRGSAIPEQSSLVATTYGGVSRGVRMPDPARSPAPANTVRYRTLDDVEDSRTRTTIRQMQNIVPDSVQECFNALVTKKGDNLAATEWLLRNPL